MTVCKPKYKVLMIGWEFPPVISGGLGVASEGIVNALIERGHELTLVLPTARGVRPREGLQILAMDEMCAPARPFTTALPGPYSGRSGKQVEGETDYVMLHGKDGGGAWTRITDRSNTASFLSRALSRGPYNVLPHGLSGVTYGGSSRQAAGRMRLAFNHLNPYAIASEAQLFIESGAADSADENVLPAGVLELAAAYADRVVELPGVEDFDLIHCHDWLTLQAGVKLKEMTGASLIAHMHSLESERVGDMADPEIAALERLGLAAADRVVAVSRETATKIHAEYGIPAWKTAVIHNGIEPLVEPLNAPKSSAVKGGKPRRKRGAKTVLFLGRITWQKGPDIFVDAAAQILAKLPATQFIMAGDGDMFEEVLEQIDRRHLRDAFILPGFVCRAEVEQLLRGCDLLVVSSRCEPFGLVALEAARAGVPVIVPNNAGVREVLPAIPSFPAEDTIALGRLVLRMLKSPAMRRRAVHDNLKKLPGISWAEAAAAIEKIYESKGKIKNG